MAVEQATVVLSEKPQDLVTVSLSEADRKTLSTYQGGYVEGYFFAFTLCVTSVAALPARADTVENAFMLCAMVDGTGLGSQPCEVDGWGGAVKVYLDMTSSEARETCSMMANMMRQQGRTFESRWKLEIYSPYSGGNAIAYCQL